MTKYKAVLTINKTGIYIYIYIYIYMYISSYIKMWSKIHLWRESPTWSDNDEVTEGWQADSKMYICLHFCNIFITYIYNIIDLYGSYSYSELTWPQNTFFLATLGHTWVVIKEPPFVLIKGICGPIEHTLSALHFRPHHYFCPKSPFMKNFMTCLDFDDNIHVIFDVWINKLNKA